MERASGDRAAEVLRVLAELAPAGEAQASGGVVVPLDWFHWLPAAAVRLFTGAPGADALTGLAEGVDPLTVPIDRGLAERLAAVDQLRANEHAIRVGWLFVAGRVVGEDGRSQRVLHPLVSVPVRARPGNPLTQAALVPAGDASLSPRIADPDQRRALYGQMEFGGGALSGIFDARIPAALLSRFDRMHRFATAAAAAAGLPAGRLMAAGDDPDLVLRRQGLVILAGVAVFAVHETGGVGRSASLRSWAGRDLGRPTAFHAVYLGDERPLPPAHLDAAASPYVLTPAQAGVVFSARHNAVTVVSGAPGTGKSHTIVAVAVDAVARGQSVLIAAKTDATVDALLDLLERAPGPVPVVFGSTERRQALAARLAGGQLEAVGVDVIGRDRLRLDEAVAHRDALRRHIVDALTAEQLLDAPSVVAAWRRLAPGLFGSAPAIAEAKRLLSQATSAERSALGGWRKRRAWRQLVALAACDANTTPTVIEQALGVAAAASAASAFEGDGGVLIGGLWEELADRERDVRRATGTWIASQTRSNERWNRRSLGAVAAVATALRSGRAARREQLARLSGDDLTHALPLWVGTLPDIDDLLPPVAGLFDVVILDEASGIDQSLAAPALLRGGRAVVAGDPRQLRHVSFLSDVQLHAALASEPLADDPLLRARLDARRNSAFDVAASAAPVRVLDEHFRSAPHLVHFAAERLYGGALHIATRSPRTEKLDCIDVVRVDGTRDSHGVVAAEVRRVVAELKALQRAQARSVGVVTPFRAQADALEAAVLEAFDAQELQDLDLRVGTVHAFQGNERDVVIASIAVGPTDTGSWRFVQDPHLFAVLITRARRRMTVLVSSEPPAGGLMADYLEQANSPYRPLRAEPVTGWASAVEADLRLAGVGVVAGYRVGRHVLDLCLVDEPQPTAVECGVHPDGPDAHIARHLDLQRSGWRVLEAFPSRWRGRRGELGVELVQSLVRKGTLAG